MHTQPVCQPNLVCFVSRSVQSNEELAANLQGQGQHLHFNSPLQVTAGTSRSAGTSVPAQTLLRMHLSVFLAQPSQVPGIEYTVTHHSVCDAKL